jgi:hypothetical protein
MDAMLMVQSALCPEDQEVEPKAIQGSTGAICVGMTNVSRRHKSKRRRKTDCTLFWFQPRTNTIILSKRLFLRQR